MHRKGLRGRFARVGLALAAVLTTVCAASVNAQVEKPKYGGSLSIGTNSPSLAPLSWDPADWNYKTAQDAGFYYDRLFIADFTKSKAQGGPYLFKSDSYLPSDAVRGDLAESWKWIDNPLRLEVKLRKGVMFPEKPGVMASRELTSQDVVYSYNCLLASPKRLADFIDLVDKFEAPDKYTVIIHFKYYHEDWGHRLGWGVFASVYPKEVVDAGIGDWKKANGSGPFMLTEYVGGNSQNYSKNPLYHGRETIGGQEYKLPFVDKVSIRIMKDEAARYAALRTAKLDLLQSITWTAAEELKKNVPQLKWARWLQHGSAYIAMRTDTKPFNDIRVRRALNMAINKQEIVSSFYGGNAEVFAYPQHPDYVGYFEPLSSMPDSIKELYTYSPDKAKKLLAEAGYPNGFTFKAHICACDPTMMDLGPLVAGYLQKIGVKMEFEPLEQGAFFSLLRAGKNNPGMAYTNSHGGPTTTLRKNFTQGQYTNNSQWNDPVFEKKMQVMHRERDEPTRQKMVRELTREILDKAPYIWLPTAYTYAAWWPWVKNYDGEIYGGSFWWAPVHARIWVDQDLKKKMGF